MNERWAPLAEAPAYEVSTEGRVRRIMVDDHGTYHDVAAWENARGYLHVNLEAPGRAWPIVRAVHRLVLDTFEPLPEGADEELEAHHLDGQKHHNALVNLAWVTHAENVQHAWDAGLQPRRRVTREGCRYGHVRSQVYVDSAGKRRVRCARCRRAHYHRAQAVRRDRAWLLTECAGAR